MSKHSQKRNGNWLDCQANWQEYERRKKEWREQHPNATPAEYQDAMRAIADECGMDVARERLGK